MVLPFPLMISGGTVFLIIVTVIGIALSKRS